MGEGGESYFRVFYVDVINVCSLIGPEIEDETGPNIRLRRIDGRYLLGLN